MENIIKTNNPNLRLAAMSVGVLSTLRVSLPLVPADATNVEIIVTAGTTHNAYAASYDSLCNVWTCDIAASQFPETGKQRYEVAYKLGGKQFWDGSGWITVESATTGGLTPAPQPDPPRYVVTTINGYGATEPDGDVRIPKLFFGTESPITAEGYIEGDQFFDRITGSLWTLCEVVGEFVWIVCQTGGDMKRSEFAGLDENESSLQDVIRLLRDGVLGVLLVSFLALFNSSALGAVEVKTARLGTLPAKATVVTNIVGAVDSDEALGIATNAIPLWARSETKPTYTASDVHARPDDWMPTAADVGAVASVNGKTGTVVIAASDVHARPDDWMPTAAEVGARPDDWMPNASDVGAVAVGANGGVAIGVGTTASGIYSHAEGRSTTALGVYSHAEGRSTTASGDFSHAEGYNTYAYGNASHAEGVYAKANENYSFSWNGDSSITYISHGIGTFNLNPLGGLSGLWIGGLNLATILGGYAKKSDVGSRGATNITDGVTSGTYNEETRTANIRPLLDATISPINPTFSNAVLSVGLNIDTNAVAVLNEISSAFGGFPIGGTATTVGGLLAALAAAVAWLKRNKADKVTTNAAPAGSVALAADRVTVVDGSSGTAVSVTIPTVDGSEMRLCELLITGVASDGALAVTHPANCLLADGADATSAGANHFVYAEYQRDRWLVTKTVLTEEAS